MHTVGVQAVFLDPLSTHSPPRAPLCCEPASARHAGCRPQGCASLWVRVLTLLQPCKCQGWPSALQSSGVHPTGSSGRSCHGGWGLPRVVWPWEGGVLLPAAAGRWQWDLARVAWQVSAQARVAFALRGGLLGWTVSVTTAGCAECPCSSTSLGKPLSPVGRF